MDETLLFEQWLSNLNTLDEPSFTAFADALNQDFTYSQHQQTPQLSNTKRSSAEQSDPSSVIMSRPSKQQKTNNSTWDSSSLLVSASDVDKKNNQVEIVRPKKEISWSSSPPSFFVFDNSSFENNHHTVNSCQGTKRISSSNNSDGIRPFSQAKEHILAERKRRERINERLISLSKLIPGLSKMDKATVLADAVKYIKQLQEKVKSLEEKNDKIKPMQSHHVVYVKRSYDNVCNNNSSSDEASSDGSVTTTTESLLPEIEARVCNKDVLISIHSQKKKGALERVVAEIEKLQLTVVNSSVMSFGDSALNISVVAQMDGEFNMNMNQLVKSLHAALDNLYN